MHVQSTKIGRSESPRRQSPRCSPAPIENSAGAVCAVHPDQMRGRRTCRRMVPKVDGELLFSTLEKPRTVAALRRRSTAFRAASVPILSRSSPASPSWAVSSNRLTRSSTVASSFACISQEDARIATMTGRLPATPRSNICCRCSTRSQPFARRHHPHRCKPTVLICVIEALNRSLEQPLWDLRPRRQREDEVGQKTLSDVQQELSDAALFPK